MIRLLLFGSLWLAGSVQRNGRLYQARIGNRSDWRTRFRNRSSFEAPIPGTSLDHQHNVIREKLKLPQGFVIHSLRHTMVTRLGESGAEAFTIMRIAGHSSVTVSQRYVHRTPEGMERAFDRLQDLNAERFEQAEAAAADAEGSGLPAKVTTARSSRPAKSSQFIEITRTGP